MRGSDWQVIRLVLLAGVILNCSLVLASLLRLRRCAAWSWSFLELWGSDRSIVRLVLLTIIVLDCWLIIFVVCFLLWTLRRSILLENMLVGMYENVSIDDHLLRSRALASCWRTSVCLAQLQRWRSLDSTKGYSR